MQTIGKVDGGGLWKFVELVLSRLTNLRIKGWLITPLMNESWLEEGLTQASTTRERCHFLSIRTLSVNSNTICQSGRVNLDVVSLLLRGVSHARARSMLRLWYQNGIVDC